MVLLLNQIMLSHRYRNSLIIFFLIKKELASLVIVIGFYKYVLSVGGGRGKLLHVI